MFVDLLEVWISECFFLEVLQVESAHLSVLQLSLGPLTGIDAIGAGAMEANATMPV